MIFYNDYQEYFSLAAVGSPYYKINLLKNFLVFLIPVYLGVKRDIMSNFTDAAISKILFDLSTIAKYKKGNVVETTSEYLNVVESSLKTSLDRSLSGDTRARALARFRQVIDIAYEYAERVLESRYLDIYKNDTNVMISVQIDVVDLNRYEARYELLVKIYKGLLGCLAGVDEFKQTYDSKNDSTTVGNCDRLRQDTLRKANSLKEDIDRLDRQKDDFEEYRAGVYDL